MLCQPRQPLPGIREPDHWNFCRNRLRLRNRAPFFVTPVHACAPIRAKLAWMTRIVAPSAVMRCSAYDQPGRSELEHLHYESTHLIAIVHGDTASAEEDAELLEMKIGDEPKNSRPMGADAFLAPQHARWLAGDICDPGR